MTLAKHALPQMTLSPARRYHCAAARSRVQLSALMALRSRVFRRGLGDDADRFDRICRHITVQTSDERVIAGCRVLIITRAEDVAGSYAAQFYDLSRLASFPAPLLEVGRVCVDPCFRGDPDILRLLWAALVGLVTRTGARMLIGCASFDGARPGAHDTSLAWLARNHAAPDRWRPAALAGGTISLRACSRDPMSDPRAGLPPLLRGYLAMGGWVGDHAVVDDDLDTLHVFTGLEIDQIPAARLRSLRALLAGSAA